ncbi:hypothetical protein QYM36_005389 [Artemia franciscana]|uniref:Uncharacterized protein n=1 Tax=Artemia franciscana TaxID=6661 RepID=A0AA88L647_ARTSF|nr:hypothetical protein QYM36_005389 [Artemia franciscana]
MASGTKNVEIHSDYFGVFTIELKPVTGFVSHSLTIDEIQAEPDYVNAFNKENLYHGSVHEHKIKMVDTDRSVTPQYEIGTLDSSYAAFYLGSTPSIFGLFHTDSITSYSIEPLYIYNNQRGDRRFLLRSSRPVEFQKKHYRPEPNRPESCRVRRDDRRYNRWRINNMGITYAEECSRLDFLPTDLATKRSKYRSDEKYDKNTNVAPIHLHISHTMYATTIKTRDVLPYLATLMLPVYDGFRRSTFDSDDNNRPNVLLQLKHVTANHYAADKELLKLTKSPFSINEYLMEKKMNKGVSGFAMTIHPTFNTQDKSVKFAANPCSICNDDSTIVIMLNHCKEYNEPQEMWINSYYLMKAIGYQLCSKDDRSRDNSEARCRTTYAMGSLSEYKYFVENPFSECSRKEIWSKLNSGGSKCFATPGSMHVPENDTKNIKYVSIAKCH